MEDFGAEGRDLAVGDGLSLGGGEGTGLLGPTGGRGLLLRAKEWGGGGLLRTTGGRGLLLRAKEVRWRAGLVLG